MEKLKSMKSYRSRSKSNQQRSIEREMIPSIEKRSTEKSISKVKEGSLKEINKLRGS